MTKLRGLNVSAEMSEHCFIFILICSFLAFITVLTLLKNGCLFPIKPQFILT